MHIHKSQSLDLTLIDVISSLLIWSSWRERGRTGDERGIETFRLTRVRVRVVQNRGPQPGPGRFAAHRHFLLSFICQRIASIWDSKGSLFIGLLENVYLKMRLNREAWGKKNPQSPCGGGIYNEIRRQSHLVGWEDPNRGSNQLTFTSLRTFNLPNCFSSGTSEHNSPHPN